MSELLLDYDRLTGMKEFISTDAMTGESFIRYEQDTKDHIDANKEAQNAGFDRKAEMWHAASIPNIVLVEWVTKYGIDFFNPNHKEGVKRLLNSSEYSHLKRAPIVI
jgi:hypothetical protein